jgi:hypothetical protein
MPGPRITIRGNSSRLRAAGNRIHAAAGQVVPGAANRVHDTARATSPYRTGNLRGTHQVEPGADALTKHVTAGGPTSESPKGADYGYTLHQGSAKRAPRPWLEQAAELEQQTFARDAEEAVRRASRD